MKVLKLRENRLIQQIRDGNESASQKLYVQHRLAFRNWVRKEYPRFPEEEIKDIYQETFLSLYFQIRDGSLVEIKQNLKSYLFAIGKNKLRNARRKNAKFTQEAASEGDMKTAHKEWDMSLSDVYQKNYQAEVVARLLNQIGEPCKTVLELSYYQHFPPESIAAHMNYKNEATARVRKVRCLQQLGKLLEEHGINYSQIFE